MPADRAFRFRAGPFLLASAVSAALILSAPFIGEIRRAILLRFPGQFVWIIGGIVAAAIGSAVVAAIIRMRGARSWRYAALAGALAIAAVYAYATRTPDPQVNAVERFHFVEYGLVTLLFYRAWRPAGDLSALALPMLAGLLVGTLEEWFQWFIPARVGDLRDIFLNLVAIVCGLLFSVALDPLDGNLRGPRASAFRWHLPPAARRRIGAFAAVVLVTFAGFFQSVHLGHAIEGDGWRFKSGYTSAELDHLAADRAARWKHTFVDRPRRLSAEDQYMTEGLWHVQRRNRAWDAGQFEAAWRENQILERYFAPVLDTPSYVSKAGHRWSAEHRADAERRFSESRRSETYDSDAHPAEIHGWPRTLYWILVAAAALLLAWPWMRAAWRHDESE